MSQEIFYGNKFHLYSQTHKQSVFCLQNQFALHNVDQTARGIQK